jgi:D-psicose/D-tagatose/L-ribulose 3-epimerase
MKVAMHNWMRREPIETTIARLGRSGYDAIEISGEPAVYDADRVRELLDEHRVRCWGAVTLMTGGRDLVHEDHYVRLASVQYVKDCLSFAASLGGRILTVVPSTIGKVVPMASPDEEWEWAVQGLRECQEHAERVGVRMGLEPLNRYETYFLNRAEQAVALAQEVGGDCGVTLDIFHMNIEEADWAQAIRDTGSYLVDFHVADSNRLPPGRGAIDWEALARELVRAGYDGHLAVEFVARVDEHDYDQYVQESIVRLRQALSAAEGAVV